ncbi:MAG: YMGG-like glycine zipper-containing protein [Pyrinomonadaceae bacterium]
MKTLQKTMVLVAIFSLMSFGLISVTMAQSQRPYRYNDRYMRQVLQRLETRTDRFSNLLPNALDRSRLDGTDREDDVNKMVTDFEAATDRLKDRFNNQQSTITDAQDVLREGARIDTFMRNRRLGNRTERAWTQVRTELDRLANAYRVASNWRYMQWPAVPVYSGAEAMLTGTFRLNSLMSDNPRIIADNATRNSTYLERQRIYNNLVDRLTPPEMIAVERRGNVVTLASSRTPQVNFEVDGRERIETYPDGRTTRVRASFSGSVLNVISNGDRVNDFTATFTPMDNGRRLLVTRQVYAERLAMPVVVRTYYDETLEIAQWSVYNGAPNYADSNVTFVIPNGAQIVALLTSDLSTQHAHDGDRFSMRVVSPAAHRNAMIEGHLTGVDRSGRFSGRSEMTFNFDRIRLANGQTYNFAGIVDEVRTPGGESVRVDNEGAIRENDSQTNTTIQRTGIGTAVGALIGAITGGGKGAAIGAAVGASAGAGSVYVQGRDDLELQQGSQFTIRASSPLR